MALISIFMLLDEKSRTMSNIEREHLVKHLDNLNISKKLSYQPNLDSKQLFLELRKHVARIDDISANVSELKSIVLGILRRHHVFDEQKIKKVSAVLK